MDKNIQLSFREAGAGHAVSPNLFGIFFEDINFSCDGGINANMVKNYSFDGIYFSRQEMKAVSDPLRYWAIEHGVLESGSEGALSESSKYAAVYADGRTVLSNLGHNGEKQYQEDPAMSIAAGHEYLFECYLRSHDFSGEISVRVADARGDGLTEAGIVKTENAGVWEKVSCRIAGCRTGYGRLEIEFCGEGRADLDCVSLMDSDYWHAGDDKWRHGKLRRDLIQALADLKPTFMRFPGGCIVEGALPGNEYDWKRTVGELYERGSNYNLWAEKIDNGGYGQSFQIGFYEYFCLCEDLNMKPLPTLSVGLNCQIRSVQRHEQECPNIPVDSEEFQTRIVDNYLDLIEFANADPAESKWAALRAKMGHPKPFGLDRIGIGNENYNEVYFERFALIERAIHQRYPDMVCVLCGGLFPHHEDFMGIDGLDKVYAFAKKFNNVLVDEHSYHMPEWFEEQSVRFDSYDRQNAGVYFGEYAANGMLGQTEALSSDPDAAIEEMNADEQGGMRPMNETNQLDTALGEAAFLTGVERNSDIVSMASYAPLFNLAESDQWNHNLINFNPKTLCLSTNYYVQQMFGANLGTQYLPYKGELPAHVFCSATGDEEKLYLKLVNTGENTYMISVSLPFTARRTTRELLQSDDPHVRNGLTFYGDAEYVIVPEKSEIQADGDELTVEVKPCSVCVVTVYR